LEPIARANPGLPPSYREGQEPRHFLGRNLPHGAEFLRWSRLSQIGKLAWFWQARNRAILEQFSRLPATPSRLQRLEALAFRGYQAVAEFFGWRSQIDAATFDEVAQARLNAGPNAPRRCTDWSAAEAAEFEAEVAGVAAALGYGASHRAAREGVS